MRAILVALVALLLFAAFAGGACTRLDRSSDHAQTWRILYEGEKAVADSEASALEAARRELDEARRQASERETLLRQCQAGETPAYERASGRASSSSPRGRRGRNQTKGD